MGRRGHIWTRAGYPGFWMTVGSDKVHLSDDRDEAERMFHAMKAEKKKVRTQGFTLEALADTWIEAIEPERSPETIDRYKRTLRSFLKFAGKHTRAEDIRPPQVRAWVADARWNGSTRNLMVSVLKTGFAWAKKQGHIADNPLLDAERPRRKQGRHVMSPEQVAALFASLPESRFKDLLTALRETGCRPIEARTLTAERVNLDAGTWKVRDKIRGKTGQEFRTVYLSPAAIELSRRLLGGKGPGDLVFLNHRDRAWTRVNLAIRVKRACGNAGIGAEGVAYSFRHLYITDALVRGIPPGTVAELVGHKSLDMIMKIYNQLKHRTDHLREAAQAIRPV